MPQAEIYACSYAKSFNNVHSYSKWFIVLLFMEIFMSVFLVVLNGGLGAILGSAIFNSYLIGGATGVAIMLFFGYLISD
jgi:hypothetical protein